jgi:hypothetical protein
MAASDGIRQYWQALAEHSQLVVFDYLDAQKVWQRHFSDLGAVKFHGNDQYIAFIQAVMMDGIKGTALISYLGELYKAGSSPTATGKSVLKTAVKKAYMGIRDYEKQIMDLKSADLSWAWRNAVKSSCRPIFDAMKNSMEISPSDLG